MLIAPESFDSPVAGIKKVWHPSMFGAIINVMINKIKQTIKESATVKEQLANDEQILSAVEYIIDVVINAYNSGHKVLAAGNGGSAADAQHFIAEFVGRYYYDRPPLPGLALTTDTSVLTAIGNDYGYDDVFSRQIRANGVGGDVFFVFSTSGNSQNLVNAVVAAKEMDIITVAFTGEKESKLSALCDYTLQMPSSNTPRVQECHALLEHIICEQVEAKIFPKG